MVANAPWSKQFLDVIRLLLLELYREIVDLLDVTWLHGQQRHRPWSKQFLDVVRLLLLELYSEIADLLDVTWLHGQQRHRPSSFPSQSGKHRSW